MEASALQAPARLTGISLSAPLLRLRSDEQLVALFRAGSEEAFRVIHDRYRQRLFAYMRQMLSGSRQDAEDALQDVFIRAHAALLASDRPISLRAWLYRVAHNRCIDQLRRPQVIPLEGVELTASTLPDPLAEAERREDLRRLIADVRRLPEQQRSMLLMRELEGASYSDLADAHGVTVAAVKSLLVRARIGLVRAAEARDIACVEIRSDLVSAHERGVRATGRARRHLRDCSPCLEYKTSLRATQRDLAAFAPPSGPLSLVAKLLGLSAGGSGAAAGGGAAASGGAVAGGGAATATACKVAAVVCSTVVAAGGAVEVKSKIKDGVGRDGRSASAMTAPGAPRTSSTSAAATTPIVLPRERAASADQRSAPATEREKAAKAKSKADEAKAPAEPAPAAVPEDVNYPSGLVEDPAPDPAPLVEQGGLPVTVGPDGKVNLGVSGSRPEDPDAPGKDTAGTPSNAPTTGSLQQQSGFTGAGSGSGSTQPSGSGSSSPGGSG